MKSIGGFMRAATALMVALAAVLATPHQAFADKLHLKDGRVLEGEIQGERAGSVWFVVTIGGIEHKQFFLADDIAKIERDEPAPDPQGADIRASADPVTASPARGSATRVAILNFGPPQHWKAQGLNVGSKVGTHIAAQAFEEAIPLLEEDGVTVVIIRINSGGGSLYELPRLNDLFHNKYKPKFRTVAWVESAISAAAMAPYCLEEFYFMPQGNLGACTAYSTQGENDQNFQALKDIELLEVLRLMENYSARGGRDPKIMRAMQIEEPLSCTIDEYGDVHWFQDTSGDHLVNPEGRILTFNAQDAVRFKFAKGIAATPEELIELMGLQEVEWAGQRATELVDNFMIAATDSERRFVEIINKYQSAIEAAQNVGDRRERGAEVNRARRFLGELKSITRVNKNFEMLRGTDEEWFHDQEQLLRRLMR